MSAPLHPHDDLAVYAVDALDPDERTAVEDHLAMCPDCRAELAGHRAALAGVVEDEDPPPWLWDQIASDVRAEAPGPAADEEAVVSEGSPDPGAGAQAEVRDGSPDPGASEHADVRHLPRTPAARSHGEARHLRPRGPRRAVVAVLAVAAAFVLALVLAPAIADRVGEGDDEDAEIVAPDLPVGAIESDAGTTIARVEADDQGSYLEFDQVDQLEPDRAYQLWSLDGPDPVSLAVLGAGTEPEVRISLPPETSSVAISDEPSGGSVAPTGPIVGTGELALPT